ncbi:DNA polymerase IV [Streptomyces sp. NPDC057638]|uniref:DNA polymerase IV n=1 Tax=Streptomyces sp. NPDC057638 TaxID=3346190 RepID=UPI0036C9D9EB
MRSAPTILHLDMDAFYAAAEQAAKPSLRGKPVIVGGLGPRGVVATASYEARRFGVHSAMPMAQARRLAPNAACLTPRFSFYRTISEQVMGLLRELSPLVEPLSLDEAFVDLEATGAAGAARDTVTARAVGERLRTDIREVTGLTGSVGLAGSKMLAKIASEQAKPDGLVLIEPGTERELLGPLPVRILPGVGPATGEHLRRAGLTICAELVEAGEDELVRLVGKAHGTALHSMALGHDDRPVVAERDTKSVSVEDTFDVDLHDRIRIRAEVERLAERCVERLRASGHSGRTIVVKVRRYDFSTLTRSETLRGPTDDPTVVREAAARLLESVDTTGGVRLLGVGVSGLADYTQEDLFAQVAQAAGERIAVRDGRAAPEAAGSGVPPVVDEKPSGSPSGPGENRSGVSTALPEDRSGGSPASSGTAGADRRAGVVAAGGGAPSDGDAGRGDGAPGQGTAGGAADPVRPGGEGGRGFADAAPGEGAREPDQPGPAARTGEPAGGAAVPGARPSLAGPAGPAGADGSEPGAAGSEAGERRWHAGQDVEHAVHGVGWVQGSGVGRVTVRFERPDSPAPGRVRTFRVNDPELRPSDPLPLVPVAGAAPGGGGQGGTSDGAVVSPSGSTSERPARGSRSPGVGERGAGESDARRPRAGGPDAGERPMPVEPSGGARRDHSVSPAIRPKDRSSRGGGAGGEERSRP